MSRQVRTYQSSVRVGNWNEDIWLEQDLLKEFLHKKDSGQLASQLTGNLLEKLTCPLPTSVTLDGYIHFGDLVMFSNCRTNCTLALDTSADKVQDVPKVTWACGVSGCKGTSPTPRNTFIILPAEKGRSNDAPVRFGEPVMLMPSGGDGIYLKANARTLTSQSKYARNHEVVLADDVSIAARWQFLHRDPRLRFEYEGIPIPANEIIIVNHMKTNERLAVEDKHQFRTAFGREYEIDAHTYLDSHKAEIDANHWVVVMATATDNKLPERISNESKDR